MDTRLSKEKSQQEYIEGYYQEMLNVVKKYKNYSVLGHLDLMTRYDEIGNYPLKSKINNYRNIKNCDSRW